MEQVITDVWNSIKTYYDDFVTLLPKLVVAILVFLLLYFIANRTKKFAQRRLTRRMDDPLLARFLAGNIKTAIILIAVLFFLHIVGLSAVAVGLLSTAGVGAFIIGFAFKDLGENFLAGVMLAFNRPFKVGDAVQLDGIEGSVVGLNLRNTQIKTFDGKDVFIPNANIIKKPVINYTIDGFLRLDFTVGLDYDTDANTAIQIVLETLKQIPGVLQERKAPTVFISEPATSTLNLTIYFWMDTYDQEISGLLLKSEAINQVLIALKKAGYYMPGDILELKNYNNLELMTNQKVNKLDEGA